jgi:hypothetical protein
MLAMLTSANLIEYATNPPIVHEYPKVPGAEFSKPPPFNPNYKFTHPNCTAARETRPINKDTSGRILAIGSTAYVHVDNWCPYPLYVYQTKRADPGCGGPSNTQIYTIPQGNNGGIWASFRPSPFLTHHS